MAGITISTKYTLKPEQMTYVMGAHEDNPKKQWSKTHWSLTNLSVKDEKGYSKRITKAEGFDVPAVEGDKQFSVTFPDGYLQPGWELMAMVGDKEVLDENEHMCKQTQFWYVDDNGQPVACRWKELPSQNGKSATAPSAPKQTTFNGAPSMGIPSSMIRPINPVPAKPVQPSQLVKKPVETDFCYCTHPEMEDKVHIGEDDCLSFFDGPEDDRHCECCKYHRNLVYFES